MGYARAVFEAITQAEEPAAGALVLTWDEIIQPENEDGLQMTNQAREYAKRLDIDLKSSPRGHAFINGRHYDINDVSMNLVLIVSPN